MKTLPVIVALLIAGPLSASQILIDAERIYLDPSNSAQHGFLVDVEPFDPVVDEYSVSISAPHESTDRTFSRVHIGRHGSLAVEVTPELADGKHSIQVFLPLDGFEPDATEITVVYEGKGRKPIFFKIDVRQFIDSAILSDR